MTARSQIRALTLAMLVTAGSSLAGDQPPANLHEVGDHWTAWDPPSPPAEDQVHVVVKGDTLWDLARKFYGDPYLWPQLWERNRYVLDAHWIYPGDPLVIGPQATAAESLDTVDFDDPAGSNPTTPDSAGTPQETKPVETSEGISGVMSGDSAATAPSPLGTESDIYCSGFIATEEEALDISIVGSEFEALSPPLEGVGQARGIYGSADTIKYGLATSDIVYLSAGKDRGLEPGKLFSSLVPVRPIKHPTSKQVVGHLYHYTGRIRVLSVQETSAIAEIVATCDPVTVGSFLKPFEPEPIPLARRTVMRPLAYPVPLEKLSDAPTIVATHDDIVAIGQDNVVYIDRGAAEDVTPGDIFTIYRRHPKKQLPPVVIGELAVLSVREHFAVAKVIASTQSIYCGDLLDLK